MGPDPSAEVRSDGHGTTFVAMHVSLSRVAPDKLTSKSGTIRGLRWPMWISAMGNPASLLA